MSGHCDFCGVWHSGPCCHPSRGIAVAHRELSDRLGAANAERIALELANAALQRDNEALRRENEGLKESRDEAIAQARDAIGENADLQRELLEAREQLDRIWDALTAAGHPADGETSTAEMVAAALLGAGQLALDMATDLAAARAKLEECGRDSTRIDWLQAQLDEHGTVWMLPCGDDMRFVQVRNFGECLNYPTVTGKLREALDAALAQDNKP